MTPCPDCKRLHIHSLHCPNPLPLPRYATVLLIEPRAVLAMDAALGDEGTERAR